LNPINGSESLIAGVEAGVASEPPVAAAAEPEALPETEEFAVLDLPAESSGDLATDVSADTVEMAVFSLPDADLPPAGQEAFAAPVDALPELVTMAEGVEIIEDAPFIVPQAPAAAASAPAAPYANSEVDDALAMFAETPVQPMKAVPEAPAAPAASAPAASAPVAPPNVPPIDPFDDLAFLHSVIAPSGSQPAVPAATVTPPSVPVSANAAEPTKTLRCTECGTMNLPTEWYCERCGGELAAF
jgi:hypothetical protein